MSGWRGVLSVVMVLVLAFQTGCTPGPRDLQMGQEECAHCRMLISEEAFASQVVMNRGRTFAFDSIECMAAWVATHESPETMHSVWVPDFNEPGSWLDASSAVFLQSESIRSPMGLSLIAFGNEDSEESQRAASGGRMLGWSDIQQLVVEEWNLTPTSVPGHSHE